MLRKTLGFILPVLAILILFNTSDASAGSTVVVPNANEAVEGDSENGIPFNCAVGTDQLRNQQMYASSEFGGATCFITEVRFRRDGSASDFGPTVIPNITVQLSTSPNDVTNMSATFADNIGSDVKTVFDGDLTLSTSCGSNDPCPFDQVIALEQGFPYDPNEGDLLLDVRIPTCVYTAQQDALGDSSVLARAVALDNFNGTTADILDLANQVDNCCDGLVTQFVCGEPSSGPIVIVPTMGQWGMIFASLIIAIIAVLVLRRRTEQER